MAVQSRGPAIGRRQATLLCSLFTALGPQSYSITFDVETKLPIAMTVWNNRDRQGTPGFRAWEITYYEDLPGSVFTVEYPQGAERVEKDLTVPESTLALLTDPRTGLVTEGMSMEQASRKILSLLYQALIEEDLGELRRLCPTLSAWNDELIRALLLGPGQGPVQIMEIRSICKQGNSSLGPIVAVPCVIKARSGVVREDKIIVQFRTIGGKSSCVVHGPYGLPREIEWAGISLSAFRKRLIAA